MQESKILYGGGAAGGFLIEQFSTKPFHVVIFHSLAFGWIYQLLIGALVFVVGISSFRISKERMPPLSAVLYQCCGVSLVIIGLFTFTNIDRYAEVFATAGTWPVTGIGIWLAFVSSLSLGHSLNSS